MDIGLKQKEKAKSGFIQILWKSFKLVAFYSNKKLKEYPEEGQSFYRLRGGMFLVGILASVIWGFTFSEIYRTTRDTPFPPYERLNVDRGTLKSFKIRNATDFLSLERDGKEKIWFEDVYPTDRYARDLDHGIAAEVWWFPLKHVRYGRIAQLEIAGERIFSYQEGKDDFEDYKKRGQTAFFISISLSFLALFAWAWEFIIQYRLEQKKEKD